MRVLIAGCGYVGKPVAQTLATQGFEVFALVRTPRTLPPGVQPVVGDFSDPRSLSNLPSGLSHLVFAAAPDSGGETGYRATYVDGLAHVLAAAQATSPALQRIVFTCSTSVYGQEDGSLVDESTVPSPTGYQGRVLLEAESLLLRSGTTSVSLRFGGIYGPGRTYLIDTVRQGVARLSPEPSPYTNRIHQDDCVGSVIHALTHPQPHPVYLAVDSDPAPHNEVLSYLAGLLNLPPPPAGTGEPDNRRGGNKRCQNARLVQSGYTFKFPSFRQGYAAMLAGDKAPT